MIATTPPRTKRLASPAQRLTGALALALAVAVLLLVALLRPAGLSTVAPVWEPRPKIPDLIPGNPIPPPR